MKYKMGWAIAIALVIGAGFLYSSYYRADMREWELLNRVPTSDIATSKRLGVYITNLNFNPAESDLGDTRYKIDEVWAEHSTSVERQNLFAVRQKNQPEIVLCVRMHAIDRNQRLAPSPVSIAVGKASRTYEPPLTGHLCIDAGLTLPNSFSLASGTRGIEVRITLSQP